MEADHKGESRSVDLWHCGAVQNRAHNSTSEPTPQVVLTWVAGPM